MDHQLAIQQTLREKFAEMQRQNPRYSMRAYAKRLGVHVGALSHILNGKRGVSRKLAERMVRRLLLDPQQRAELLGKFPVKRIAAEDAGKPSFEPRYLALSAAQYRIAAEWEHFAVLSLLNCEGFESSASWIARRLGITEVRAQAVVTRLLELDLARFDAQGTLTRAEKSYRTPDDMADLSLKKHHEQGLELAARSLFRDSVKDRDFTSVTMAIDPSKLSAAKELIRRQADELSDLLESGHRTEVYRFSAQLIPLSALSPKEKLS